MSKLITGDKLVKAIADLEVSANKIAERIHLIACSVAADVAKTGNVTNLNAFMKATEKIGKRSVMRWLAKHAPVKLNAAKDGFILNETKVQKFEAEGYDAVEKRLLEGPTHVSEAPKSDTNPFIFDLDNALIALHSRAVEASKKASEPGSTVVIDTDRLTKLSEMVAGIKRKSYPKAKLTAASATANQVAA